MLPLRLSQMHRLLKNLPTDSMVSIAYTFLLTSLIELKKSLVLLEKAATDKDFKVCATLTKNLKKLRKQFSLSDSLLVL